MTARHPGRPKAIGPFPKCLVPECLKSSEGGSKGYCQTHYGYLWAGKLDPLTNEISKVRLSKYSDGVICSVDGCTEKPVAKSLCSRHYQQSTKGSGIVVGRKGKIGRPREGACRLCHRPVFNGISGFCQMHYARYRRGQLSLEGTVLAPLKKIEYPIGSVCKVPGCTLAPVNKWMCNAHRQQCKAKIIDEDGSKLRELRSGGKKRPQDWSKILDGYVLVLAPKGHPHARLDGSILQHRLIMEQSLGRVLEDHELVHHKNGNRQDNRIENLELLDGRAKSGREGHPPGSDFDLFAAIQVCIQQEDLPSHLKEQLLEYRSCKARIVVVV